MNGETATPYPGLRPFRRDELSLFFGREEQVDQLVETLGKRRFLGVVGISGCGKSSLVRAGLIPALESGFLAAAGARWRVAEMRPGAYPMRRLAEALLASGALVGEGDETPEADDPRAAALLHSMLRRGPLGLVEALTDTPLPPRTNLLLLVDQFEEIFRYHEHGDSEEAKAFVALLLASAQAAGLPIYVVLTMRSDFLGECALFTGLPEALNDSQFLTPRLSREQRRASIVGPAGVYGGQVEPALVNRLLNDMGEEPDQLPLMQHLLMRMWRHAEQGVEAPGAGAPVALGLAGYRELGGFADALSWHADEELATLSPAQKRIAQAMFRGLTERGAGSPTGRQGDTRRPATVGEVAAACDVDPVQVIAVADVFRRSELSFLMPPVGVELSAESVLDISHESLIRQWRQLAEWVETEGRSAFFYRRLRQTALLWREGSAGLWGSPDLDLALAWREHEAPTEGWAQRYGGDFELAMQFLSASVERREQEVAARARAEQAEAEQHRIRQRNLWLALGLVGALVLAAVAIWEARLADRRGREAQISLVLAQAHKALGDYPQRSLLLAVEALDMSRGVATKQGAVRQTLQEALTNVGGEPLIGHQAPILALAVSRDGRWAATGDAEGLVLLWLLEGWSYGAPPPVPIPLKGTAAVNALAFSPDGRLLAAGGEDRAVRLFALDRGEPPTTPLATLPSSDSSVNALAFSGDGRWLAAGVYDWATLLWKLDGEPPADPVVLAGHSDVVTSVCFGPDSRWLVTASADNTLRRWDLAAADPAKAVTVLAGHRGAVLAQAISADGRWLASGGGDRTVRLWDLQAVAPSATQIELKGHQSAVTAVGFSADGRWLASASSDKTARLWNLTQAGVVVPSIELRGHRGPIEHLTISPDSRWLITVSRDKTARLWNLEDEQPAGTSRELRIHDKAVVAAAVSPDGRWLLTASEDYSARRWQLGKPMLNSASAVLNGHADTVRHLLSIPSRRWLATASDDATARLWDLGKSDPGFHSTVLSGHTSAVVALALSPDERWLATASDDNTARLWDLESADPSADPRVLRGHRSSIYSVAFHPSSPWLATGSSDGTVRLWNLQRPAEPVRILPVGGLVAVIAFSPDGRHLAAAGADGVVRVWSAAAWEGDWVAGGKPPAPLELKGHEAPIPALLFTPDSRRVISGSWDSTVRVWDLEATPEVGVTVLRGHRHRVTALALSPNGQKLASASLDATIGVWDLAASDIPGSITILWGHHDGVLAVTFSAQGRWVLSGSADETARLWDLESADPSAEPGVLLGHVGPVTAVAIGAGNRLLMTGSEDDDARLWNAELWQMENPELSARACAVAGRTLGREEWERLLPTRAYHSTCGED